MAGIKRDLAKHRVPGVCASLLGFLFSFTGAMLISLGSMKQSFNNKPIKLSGSFSLIIGISLVAVGFAHQHLTHRKWKRRRLRKEERRRKRRRANELQVQVSNGVSTEEIILGVDQLSGPFPTSSGEFSGPDSANSSLSSLSDIPDITDDREMNTKLKNSGASVRDFSIFCIDTSSSSVNARDDMDKPSSQIRKSNDSSKVNKRIKPSPNESGRFDDLVNSKLVLMLMLLYNLLLHRSFYVEGYQAASSRNMNE
ncbi:hypothetical protein CAPTEDRAFT_198154 [Capitella teleta]|uniref:Uncharacterized protein n=1 Tax=Capitella teleta TaxID=283909 RepID=X1ZYC1_CAPTE|nr:hypothetical protein CAPTEDRAFT_198154 [Capitella teleta]|eukprot:ELU04702.1 hypothetical protein CAPTEDRAFT_198154 [Capitella teleta]